MITCNSSGSENTEHKPWEVFDENNVNNNSAPYVI